MWRESTIPPERRQKRPRVYRCSFDQSADLLLARAVVSVDLDIGISSSTCAYLLRANEKILDLKMPKKPLNEITGPGRPLGSRNRLPQLRQLVLTAAETSGYPTKKWIIEEDLDSEGNVQWVKATDPRTKEPLQDKKGNQIYRKKMTGKQVLEWTGARGALGYLLFTAQEERNQFQALLKLAQHQQDIKSDVDEGPQFPTLEELREEWIRRGLRAVDFDRMKTVTGIEAKQRVELIKHDPSERSYGSSKQSAKQSREATSPTDPESEQWWPDEEDEDGEAED